MGSLSDDLFTVDYVNTMAQIARLDATTVEGVDGIVLRLDSTDGGNARCGRLQRAEREVGGCRVFGLAGIFQITACTYIFQRKAFLGGIVLKQPVGTITKQLKLPELR